MTLSRQETLARPARPDQQALRKGRVSLPGQTYVLTTVNAARRPLFDDLSPGRLVVAEMRRLHEAGAVNSLAFVVMPDHLLNIDIETCRECGGAMKVIACIEDSVVIQKILNHLKEKGEHQETYRLPESRSPPQTSLFG